MGLLERSFRANAQKKGLLSAAEDALRRADAQPQTFASLCLSCGFPHAGLLRETDGLMVMRHAYGVDAETVARSVATKSFWSGTVRDRDSWYKPDGFGFEDFYQLFSTELADSITSAAFLRFADGAADAIFVAYSLQGEKFPELPRNVPALCARIQDEPPLPAAAITFAADAQGAPSGLYLLPLAVPIEKSIEGIDLITEDIQHAVLHTVFGQAVSIMYRGIAAPNLITYTPEMEFKLAMSMPNELDGALFTAHLQHELRKILGNAAEYISLMPAGACKIQEGIKDFLLKG